MFEKIKKGDIQEIVAIVCVLGLFALSFLMFFKGIPAENKDIVVNMMGILQGAIVVGVFGWLYSQNKNKPNL